MLQQFTVARCSHAPAGHSRESRTNTQFRLMCGIMFWIFPTKGNRLCETYCTAFGYFRLFGANCCKVSSSLIICSWMQWKDKSRRVKRRARNKKLANWLLTVLLPNAHLVRSSCYNVIITSSVHWVYFKLNTFLHNSFNFHNVVIKSHGVVRFYLSCYKVHSIAIQNWLWCRGFSLLFKTC